MKEDDVLKYPIGKFYFEPKEAEAKLPNWVSTINDFPDTLQRLLESMSDDQLDSPYRPEGWTGRQVVHHLADSHTHALIRFKWTLTEERPLIKPYLEDKYAQLWDYHLPVASALSIIRGVHTKWKCIMQHMSADDWNKGYDHPQSNKFFSLREAAALYAWHSMHHLGHLNICASKVR